AVEPVRPGAGRHPGERAPDARTRLRHLRLQARRLHAGGRAGGTGRLPLGRADRLHQPGADGVPHQRARHHDGHPRWHGQLRRRHRRRVRLRVPAALVQGPARDRRLQHGQALAALDGPVHRRGGRLRAARAAGRRRARAAPQGARRCL
ncbi:MAG: Benzoate transport, inner-membrane translocator precursor, partial [uncultured Ramlibacter sp.]